MTSKAIRAVCETLGSVNNAAKAGIDFSVPAVCSSRQALHLSAADSIGGQDFQQTVFGRLPHGTGAHHAAETENRDHNQVLFQ